MIDYQKLQEALEIVEKMDAKASVEVCFYTCGEPKYVFNAPTSDDCFCVNSVNELVKKLRELTQPEPRYKVGDKVWYFQDSEINEFTVDGFRQQNNHVEYTIHGHGRGLTWRKETDLYPSREALIESQIEYWQSMAEENKKYYQGFGYNGGSGKCEHKSDGESYLDLHESDGEVYAHIQKGRQPSYLCKKCGDFY